jgi:hypothetical protein
MDFGVWIVVNFGETIFDPLVTLGVLAGATGPPAGSSTWCWSSWPPTGASWTSSWPSSPSACGRH